MTVASGNMVDSVGVFSASLNFYASCGDGRVSATRAALHLLPDLSSDVVLGMDWLREYNPRVNWSQCTVDLPCLNFSTSC